MSSFNDSQGDSWDVKYTFREAIKLKEECDLNLADIFDDIEQGELLSNPKVFGELLWAAVEKQAVAEGLSPDAFFSLLSGGAIDDAQKAVGVALANFTQSRSERNLTAMQVGQKKLALIMRLSASELAKMNKMMDEISSQSDIGLLASSDYPRKTS